MDSKSSAYDGTRELSLWSGATDVTPSQLGPLAGYEARHGAHSTGKQDGLEAVLVALDDGVRPVAWLALDAIAAPRALTAELRRAVQDEWQRHRSEELSIVVAASHTHSAPRGWVGSIHPGHGGTVQSDDVAELVARVRSLAGEIFGAPALRVRPTWSDGRVDGLGTNRIDPGRPYDDSVGALVLRTVEDGAVCAVVFDAATHPTVLGPNNLRWSGDWPGAARRVLRSALTSMNRAAGLDAPPPVVLFLQGAAGDVSTRFTRRGDDIHEVVRLGTIAAAAAMSAIVHDSEALRGGLRFHARTLELPRRPIPKPEEAADELSAALAERARLTGAPRLEPGVRLAETRVDGARVQQRLAMAELDEVVRFPVSAIALGDAAWVHVPVELFADIGLRIRATSPFPNTRVIGYCDDYLGYMVDEHAAQTRTYEALSSLFLADTADLLVTHVHNLLEELR